jgi:hypothetical protein
LEEIGITSAGPTLSILAAVALDIGGMLFRNTAELSFGWPGPAIFAIAAANHGPPACVEVTAIEIQREDIRRHN